MPGKKSDDRHWSQGSEQQPGITFSDGKDPLEPDWESEGVPKEPSERPDVVQRDAEIASEGSTPGETASKPHNSRTKATTKKGDDDAEGQAQEEEQQPQEAPDSEAQDAEVLTVEGQRGAEVQWTTSAETAVVRRTSVPAGVSRYEPENLREAATLAKYLATSNLVPKAFQGRPQDLLLVLMRGAELGVSAATAIQNAHVIDGKVAFSADLLTGVIKRNPDCEYIYPVESTSEKAVVIAKRRGYPEPIKAEFNMQMAQRAGLLNKNNWKTYPADMMIARAKLRAGRQLFEDLLAGLYSQEELEGFPRETETVPGNGGSRLDAAVEKLQGAS